MVRVREEQVWKAIKRCAGATSLEVGNAKIRMSLQPRDVHREDCPDFLLWLEVDLRIFAQELRVRIPIPIEAEAGGIDDALEDLEKFIKRGHYPLEIPFLVVAASGYHSTKQEGRLLTHFTLKQIPERLLSHSI